MKALVKVGGALAEDPLLLADLARQIASAQASGHALFVVHGGGRQLTRALERRGIESRFFHGLRITGEQAIQTVTEVLGGSVNTAIVAALRAAGASAVGLSGIDAHLTTAAQLAPELGAVGRIHKVDPSLLHLLAQHGHIPVIACIAADDRGTIYNVNADRMASACAAALQVDHLIFLTDVPGVQDESGTWARELDAARIRKLIADGTVTGGMRAKLEAAMAALTDGLRAVTITSGALPGALEVFDGKCTGTRLVSG